MKYLYIALGLLSMAVGAVGVVLPLLPTVPFLLLASFFFAKGSDRFHNWFKSTKLYKNHLESFEKNRSMTLKQNLYCSSGFIYALYGIFDDAQFYWQSNYSNSINCKILLFYI